MTVRGIINRCLRDKRIVVRQYACRPDGVYQCSVGYVEAYVTEQVDRSAEYRLGAEGSVISMESPVLEDADVVRAAVGFDKIISHVEDIVAREINRNSFLAGLWQAMRIDTNAIMEVRDVIVTYDVALTVNLYRVIGGERRWFFQSIPTQQCVRIMPADHDIVRNVEVF